MSHNLPPGVGRFAAMPPADLPAEQSVLGGMMFRADLVPEVQKIIQATDFYKPAHVKIYRAIEDLHDDGRPVDAITVSAELDRRHQLQRIGGAPYLHTLLATVPTAVNTTTYADRVREKAILRRLTEAGLRIEQLGYYGIEGAPLNDVVHRAHAALQDATGIDHTTEQPADLTRTIAQLYQPIDWHELWATTTTQPEWLVPDILERGRSSAIVAPPKTGKSLLTLDMVAALACRRPLLGHANPHPHSIKVLYIDIENALGDIRQRLGDMQYQPEDLSEFKYLSFPNLPALDTPRGGEHLHALVDYYNPELVVFDTTSRIINGEENKADTFRALYRYALAPLKARGVGSLRLDHTGKDLSAGQRGSSAKADDLDTVWLLLDDGRGRYTLRLTFQRTNHHPAAVELIKSTDPLRFTRIHPATTEHPVLAPQHHTAPRYTRRSPSAAEHPSTVPAARYSSTS